MNGLRCIIAEDEPIARKIIREFIGQIEYLELAGEFENAIKAESFLQKHEADILFLDIEMPRLSGIDYLKSCTVKPLVIITTAYPEYALEGYELDVIDYLVKPIAFARFLKAAQKAKEYIELSRSAKNYGEDYLFVRCDRRIEKIDLADVLYFESNGNYVSIVFAGKKLVAYLTLKNLEEQLPRDRFLKVHRSFLVNFSRIEKVEDNHIVAGGKPVPIGRSYHDTVSRMIAERLLKR